MFAKNRFMSLWYNIHVVDNTPSVPRDHSAHDRLFKILRLITILNDTCGELRSVAEHFHRRKHGMFQRPQHDETVFTHEVNQARLRRWILSHENKMYILKILIFKIWCSSHSCCGYLLKFRFTPARRPKEIADSLIEL